LLRTAADDRRPEVRTQARAVLETASH
jgi:hypothetical protein